MIQKILILASLVGTQLVSGFDGFSTSVGINNFNASIDNDIEVNGCFKIADLRIKDSRALNGRYNYSDSDILKALLLGCSKENELDATASVDGSKMAIGKNVDPDRYRFVYIGKGVIGTQVPATGDVKIESGQDPVFQYAPGTKKNYAFLGNKEGNIWIDRVFSKIEKKQLSYDAFLDICARCARANIKSDAFSNLDTTEIGYSIEQGRQALKSILAGIQSDISAADLRHNSVSQLDFLETIFGKDFYEVSCSDPNVNRFIRDYIRNGTINTEIRDNCGLVQLSNDILNYSKAKTVGIIKKVKLGNSFYRSINGFFVGMSYRYSFKKSFYIGVSCEFNGLNYKNKKCPHDDFFERDSSDLVVGQREDIYDIKVYKKDNINEELPARPLRITSIKDIRKAANYNVDSNGIITDELEAAKKYADDLINSLNLSFEDIGFSQAEVFMYGYTEVGEVFKNPTNVVHFQIYNTLIELLRKRQYTDIIITDFPYIGTTTFSKKELQELYEKYGSNIQLLDSYDQYAVLDNNQVVSGVVYRNKIKNIFSFDITIGKGFLNNLILLELFIGGSRRQGNCSCSYKVYNSRGISEHTNNIKIHHWSPTFGVAAYLKLQNNISVFSKLRYIMPKKIGHARLKKNIVYSMGINIGF